MSTPAVYRTRRFGIMKGDCWQARLRPIIRRKSFSVTVRGKTRVVLCQGTRQGRRERRRVTVAAKKARGNHRHFLPLEGRYIESWKSFGRRGDESPSRITPKVKANGRRGSGFAAS
jgi:hypothetical protein